jgi:hypothetical protein
MDAMRILSEAINVTIERLQQPIMTVPLLPCKTMHLATP